MPRFILPRLTFFHSLFWLIVPQVQFEIIGGPFFLATLLGIQVTFEFFGKFSLDPVTLFSLFFQFFFSIGSLFFQLSFALFHGQKFSFLLFFFSF